MTWSLSVDDFEWDEFFWTTSVTVDSWRHFTYTWGEPVKIRDARPTGGSQLVFAPEGRGAGPLTPDEVALMQWFVDHAEDVTTAVLDAIFLAYPEAQEEFRDFAGADTVPDVASPRELRHLLGTPSVNVHNIDTDGVPYIGFGMDCPWDQEHGVGVLLHGTRVVAVGGGDVAVLRWIARRDAESTDRDDAEA